MGKEAGRHGFVLAVVLVLGAMLFASVLSPSGSKQDALITGMQAGGSSGSTAACACPLKDIYPGVSGVIDNCDDEGASSSPEICKEESCWGKVTVNTEDPFDRWVSATCKICDCPSRISKRLKVVDDQGHVLVSILDSCFKTGGQCKAEEGTCGGGCVYRCENLPVTVSGPCSFNS